MSEVKTNKISSLASNNDITLDPDGTGNTIIASGEVGVGTTTPATYTDYVSGSNAPSVVVAGSQPSYVLADTDISGNDGTLGITKAGEDTVINNLGAGAVRISNNGAERMRINSSGDLAIGNTVANTVSGYNNQSGGGFTASDSHFEFATTSNRAPVEIGKNQGSDGQLIVFRQQNTTVGQIGVDANAMYVGGDDTGLIFQGFFDNAIIPYAHSVQNIRDDAIDLGYGSSRFDDIFATNTSITTSDQNEKQQIAALTSAEITAAKAISALFKTYKWNKSVTNNGDAARIHTGVIAQEVQAAMSAAGLDATKYAFWCSNTWWEADETYTDDEGAEQTRTRQYHVEDEAPEGATERTRLGIRYAELLAFIGAATEQRLADLETRVTALEDA